MAYQFADGFDNYGNTYTMTAGYPWDTISGAPVTNTAQVRFVAPGSLPGASLQSSGNAYVRKNLVGNPATMIATFGTRYSALPVSGNYTICSLWDSGTVQCELAVNSNGALQFYRGNSQSGGTAIGAITPNATFAAGTWFGMQIQVTISTTVGTVALYLNGSASPAISSTTLNTQATANAFATQISIGSPTGTAGTVTNWDDFLCFDTTGVAPNSLLSGDARLLTKMPSGAGTYTNWTPTGLGANWQNAAVQPPNTSDYNLNNVSTTKDSYATQVASLGVAPYIVIARASLERDDAGTHTPGLFVRSGSTDSSPVVTPALTSSYLFYDAVFANDPSTGTAWTGSGADNAQVGIIEG